MHDLVANLIAIFLSKSLFSLSKHTDFTCSQASKVENSLSFLGLFILLRASESYISIMTTTKLSASEADSFDYLIIGGGTAGCVIASRLADYLPKKRILLIEAGPSDFMNDKVLNLKDWLNLLGGELDYDYGTTEQPNGERQLCFFILQSVSRWHLPLLPKE